MKPAAELRRFLRAALWEPVGSVPDEDAATIRRRRLVVTITLLVGAVVLSWTLRLPPGSVWFVPGGLALAVVWAGGAFASGPLHAGLAHTRAGQLTRPVLQPFLIGAALLTLFLAGGVVVSAVPVLREPVQELLRHSQAGSWVGVASITLINGIAEELFFRGALFSAARRHAVLVSTLVYTLTTVGTGVPLLVFAALVLGVITGLQRRVTRGVLAPIITHLTWSLGMFFLLPVVLSR